jgi:hypothetical protein
MSLVWKMQCLEQEIWTFETFLQKLTKFWLIFSKATQFQMPNIEVAKKESWIVHESNC